MNDSDKPRFVALVKDVESFYRKDSSTFALSVWWAACQPFDFDQVAKAMTAHATDPEHGRFAPLPADIVKALQGTHGDRSLVAWGKVLDGIRSVGAYTSVAFDDAVIHAVIEDMGGWPQLCRGELKDLPFAQKRFCDTYKAYAKQPVLQYPAKLLGAHDQDNALHGFAASSLAYIGDPGRAKNVLLHGSTTSKTAVTMGSPLPLPGPGPRLVGGTQA